MFLWKKQWKRVCLWLFCLFIGLFFSYWVTLSSLDVRTFALYYCILFCCVWLSYLGAWYILKKKQRRGESILERIKVVQGELGRVDGGKSVVWLWCIVWEKNLFSVKRKIGVKYERSVTNNNMAIIIATETNSAPCRVPKTVLNPPCDNTFITITPQRKEWEANKETGLKRVK